MLFVYFVCKSRVDLEFLWMLLERFGVNPPSLDSVLSFKIDGLEEMLPVNPRTWGKYLKDTCNKISNNYKLPEMP